MNLQVSEIKRLIRKTLIENREESIQDIVASNYGEISYESVNEIFKLTSHLPTVKRIIKMIRWKAEDLGRENEGLDPLVPEFVELLRQFFLLKKSNSIVEKDLGKYTWGNSGRCYRKKQGKDCSQGQKS